LGSAEHAGAHPHLELNATTPTKSGLNLFFIISTPAGLDAPVVAPAIRGGLRPAPGAGPRSPPSTPPPPIRAPPSA
jgi:hypothetical protein